MSKIKQQVTDSTLLICPYKDCNKRFKRLYTLKLHVIQHQNQKYICLHEDCTKVFTKLTSLKRHEENVHDETKALTKEVQSTPYNCTESNCDRKFQSNYSLKRHLKTFHIGKDYKCSYCQQAFRKCRQLKIHEASHTGIDPFKCNYQNCGKTFMLPSKLKQHQKIHKGYVCDAEGCQEKFEKWTLYQNHKKLVHQRTFTCQVCERIFKSKARLKVHNAVHSEERQIFVCSYEGCPKFFFYDRNLKHHIRSTHEGRRHKCTFEGCESEFKYRVTLMHHLKLHNQKMPIIKSKKQKAKNRRKDFGQRKKSAAALISGCQPKEDRQLVTDDNGSSKAKEVDQAMEMVEVIISTCIDGEKIGSSTEREN